jgi:hypothetical protein
MLWDWRTVAPVSTVLKTWHASLPWSVRTSSQMGPTTSIAPWLPWRRCHRRWHKFSHARGKSGRRRTGGAPGGALREQGPLVERIGYNTVCITPFEAELQ